MRLLQIDTCLNTGSTGRITESIAQLAIRQGWECFIIHGARYAKPPSCMKSFQTVTKNGEYIHYFEGLLLDNHGLASTRATKAAVKWVKEVVKPDVIQLHCIHGYYLNYQFLFEYLNTLDIPIVWTFHDCWAFTGHCAHFVSVNCNRWKEEGCHDCPMKGRYPKALVDKSRRNYKLKKEIFTANKNLHIVTVSKWLQGLAEQSFFKGRDIRTIYNGVDTDVFKPTVNKSLIEKYHLEGKHVLVAAATAWSKNKGLEDYKKLCGLLPQDIALVLIGLTKEQIGELPSGIIGLGRTESATELALFYTMADVVMNLSYQETFGLTTAEGMACGTPGIVYNASASPELVTPETGMVVEAGDIEGVVKAVTRIIQKGKNSYSQACRERVLSYFEKNKQFETYLQLYYQLLGM